MSEIDNEIKQLDITFQELVTDAIVAMQAKIGIDDSDDSKSLDFRVRMLEQAIFDIYERITRLENP